MTKRNTFFTLCFLHKNFCLPKNLEEKRVIHKQTKFHQKTFLQKKNPTEKKLVFKNNNNYKTQIVTTQTLNL